MQKNLLIALLGIVLAVVIAGAIFLSSVEKNNTGQEKEENGGGGEHEGEENGGGEGEPYTGGAIRIESNEDFKPSNGVSGGSGTPQDPYIIEGIRINSSTPGVSEPYGVYTGMYIFSTDVHFIIRDCVVENLGPVGVGISLSYVKNGRIENCTLRGMRTGISFLGSSAITIQSNTITDCETGIESGSSASSNIEMVGNTILNCEEGISFHYLDGSKALGNTVRGCDHGLRVTDSMDSLIENNIVQGNGDGITISASLYGFGNVTVSRNNVSGNEGSGIVLTAENITLQDNTCTGNGGYGIMIDYVVGGLSAVNNIVKGNVASQNVGGGIYVGYTCTGNIIRENLCTGNNYNSQYYFDGTPYFYDIEVYEAGNILENNVYETIYYGYL